MLFCIVNYAYFMVLNEFCGLNKLHFLETDKCANSLKLFSLFFFYYQERSAFYCTQLFLLSLIIFYFLFKPLKCRFCCK